MTWARFDDASYDHPKIVDAASRLDSPNPINECFGAWARMIVWSCKTLTDGRVPLAIAMAIASSKTVLATLCQSGLLHEVGGGYQLHDFADYQPDSVEERKKRADLSDKRREAGRKGGLARAGKTVAIARAIARKKPSKKLAIAKQNPSPDPDPLLSDTIVSGDGEPSRKQEDKADGLPFRAARAMALVSEAAGAAFVNVAPLPGGYAIAIEGYVKQHRSESDWTNLGEYLASGRVHFDEAPGPSVLAGNYGAELLAKAAAWAKAGKPAKGANGALAAPIRASHAPLPRYVRPEEP